MAQNEFRRVRFGLRASLAPVALCILFACGKDAAVPKSRPDDLPQSDGLSEAAKLQLTDGRTLDFVVKDTRWRTACLIASMPNTNGGKHWTQFYIGNVDESPTMEFTLALLVDGGVKTLAENGDSEVLNLKIVASDQHSLGSFLLSLGEKRIGRFEAKYDVYPSAWTGFGYKPTTECAVKLKRTASELSGQMTCTDIPETKLDAENDYVLTGEYLSASMRFHCRGKEHIIKVPPSPTTRPASGS